MSTPRPRSVTLGCVYGGLGGLLTAVTLIDTLRGWGSLEMQETLRSSLDQIGADVGLDAVLTPLRWGVMVLLVGAIAATVFSFYAARGHQASRIGLTVLAGLATLTFAFSGVAGVLPAILSGLVVYLLWSGPAREWFAVVNGRTPLSLGASPSMAGGAPSATPPSVAPHRQDPVSPDRPVPPVYQPSQHPEHAPAAAAPAPASTRRPRAVTRALVIAGVGSALGAAMSGIVLLALVALRDQVVEQYQSNDLLQRQLDQAGITADQMVTFGAWLFGAWAVVSVAGLLATAWAATGRASGWWALLITTVVMAGTAALGLPIGLLWLVGAIIVIVQWCKPESKAWFRRA